MYIQIFTLARRESLFRDLEWRFVIVHYSPRLSGSLGEDLVCEKAGRGDFPEIEGGAAIFAAGASSGRLHPLPRGPGRFPAAGGRPDVPAKGAEIPLATSPKRSR